MAQTRLSDAGTGRPAGGSGIRLTDGETSAMTAYQTEQHTQALERMVRETGYNLVRLIASGERGESYSRARCLYDQAVNLLHLGTSSQGYGPR